MATKKSHRGTVRGEVTPRRTSANVQLDHEEALKLIRHVAEALTYSNEVIIEPRWGKRGEKGLYRIDVQSG